MSLSKDKGRGFPEFPGDWSRYLSPYDSCICKFTQNSQYLCGPAANKSWLTASVVS